MKILLTGHLGFIGSHMLKRLTNDGHTVYSWDWQEGRPWPILDKTFDWVIHMGAISSTTEDNVCKILLQNYSFTSYLLSQCIINDINIQWSSSAGVYGNSTVFDDQSSKTYKPLSLYATTKYLCETLFINTENPLPIINQGFRYFNVYGSGEAHKHDQASVFHKFPIECTGTGKLALFEGSDEIKRDFVWVGDVIETHIQMLERKICGVFNVGTGTATSFESIGEAIAEKLWAKVEYIEMPEELKKQYQYYTCADMTKTNLLVNINWKSPKDWIEENV